MSTTSNTAQSAYIEDQVKAFIERIGDTGTWDKAAALSELSDWIDSATFKMPRNTPKPKYIAPEDMCMARSWALGVGGQCKKAKHGDGDFCKCCAKKFSVCKEAASYNMDGSHKGLFWGRVDEDLPIEAADGKGIAIMWKNDEVKDQIRELLDDGGSWHPFCTHPPCRTADWEASPITTMTSRKKSKKSKSKKTKSKRTKNAYLFFMADTRSLITANLLKFVEDTQMTPILGVYFLSENDNNIDAALAAFKKLRKKKKFFKKRLDALDIEGDGTVSDDFVFKGKYAMGPIGKLGGALWGKMTDAAKKPFKDMAEEAKAAAIAASDDESEDVEMNEDELEASDVEDGGVNSDDDDLEIEDIKLDDGTTIMVDERDLIYNEDGEEIGVYDRKAEKASYYADE